MKRRSWEQAGVLLALALATGACGNARQTPAAPSCSGSAEALAPGELVAGQDPAALLEPYWGSFDATLSWEDGGSTPLTLTLSPGTDAALYAAPLCATPTSIYTYPELGLTTEDGGLDETDTAILDVPLPGKPPYGSAGVLSPSVISDWQWHGAIAPHLPSDSASYEERGLVPVVAWAPGEPQPSSLFLYFYGRPSGTNVYDRIVVASATFP